METKWIVIMMIGVFGGLFAADSYRSHNVTQCVVAAINQGMSAEDIDKVCRKQ